MRIDFPSLSPKEEWIDIKLGYFCYQYTQFKKAKTISCCEGILVLAELQCGRQCTDAAKQDLEDLNIAGRPWCCSWSSNTLATWCEELTHWKRPWCWERLKAEGGDNRGWDGWMTSPTWWTWVWVGSRSWWWTGKPGMLQSIGSQRVGHNWATELSWCPLGFPGGSVIKNPASAGGEGSLGQEDPLEKERATHSSILAWEIPWAEDPGRLQSLWSKRVGHDLATEP